jgi:hypothetical protein
MRDTGETPGSALLNGGLRGVDFGVLFNVFYLW